MKKKIQQGKIKGNFLSLIKITKYVQESIWYPNKILETFYLKWRERSNVMLTLEINYSLYRVIRIRKYTKPLILAVNDTLQKMENNFQKMVTIHHICGRCHSIKEHLLIILHFYIPSISIKMSPTIYILKS